MPNFNTRNKLSLRSLTKTCIYSFSKNAVLPLQKLFRDVFCSSGMGWIQSCQPPIFGPDICAKPESHPKKSLRKRGSPLYKLFGAGWGQKGVGGFFFKNPTTQLRVVWGLTEKKCEQTPKFACFSVQRRPLHEVGLQASCN